MLKHSISVLTSDAQAKQREGSEQGPQPVDGTQDPDVVGEFDHFVDSHISVGGRLKSFSDQWKRFTSDEQILQTVSGYKIEFVGHPPIQVNPPYQFNLGCTESQTVDTEILRLLDKNLIKYSHHEDGEFISTIFTRPKKDGGHRMILNLSKLNDHIEYHHFKMDTLETALNLYLLETTWLPLTSVMRIILYL